MTRDTCVAPRRGVADRYSGSASCQRWLPLARLARQNGRVTTTRPIAVASFAGARLPFVGETHKEACARLVSTFNEVERQWRPRLVNVTAETGVGKTRVVQEFFATVAARDPYWPPVITRGNDRKAVEPRAAFEGQPRIFWFGIPCYRDPSGRPTPALEIAMERQVRVHARALLTSEKRSQHWPAALKDGARVIGALVGLGAVDELAKGLIHLSEAKDVVTELRAGAQAGEARDGRRSPIIRRSIRAD